MKALLTIIVTLFTVSTVHATTAKCRIAAPGEASGDEKSVEVPLSGASGNVVDGSFILKLEGAPNEVPIIVLIDAKHGALATGRMSKDTRDGRVQVGFVDQAWAFHVTGTANCKLVD